MKVLLHLMIRPVSCSRFAQQRAVEIPIIAQRPTRALVPFFSVSGVLLNLPEPSREPQYIV